jgi:chromosome segregation ATPase
MTESTNQDIDTPAGLAADPDALAGATMPDLQKLEIQAQTARARVVARQATGEGDLTDAKRKARQAEEQLREGQELAQQIEAARAHVARRDAAQAQSDHERQLASQAVDQAGKLESAAADLERAAEKVDAALSAIDTPLSNSRTLDSATRSGLKDVLGQLYRDCQTTDRSPLGAPDRLRRAAGSLRRHFDAETTGEVGE